MNRTLKIAIPVLVFLVALPIGGYAYWLVGRPTKAPSAATQPANGTPPTQAPMPEASSPQALPVTTSGAETVFRILSEESTATFTLGEVLRGEPKTVVGSTNNVSGEIALDREALDQARLGTIRINARTFVTDSEQRNRAIVRMIFKSEDDANEFIEFTPTKIDGIPASAASGVPFAFAIEGDLKLSGVTKPATFLGTAAFEADDRLVGSAETVIRYGDWGLSVPDLPFLADVDEDVKLSIEFVATK
jgi:polyisoprenoid-binding protein YceI